MEALRNHFRHLEFDELKPDVSLEHSESKYHPSAGFKSKLKRFFHYRTFTYKNMASGKKYWVVSFFAPGFTDLNLLSPQAAVPRLFLFLSQCIDSKQFENGRLSFLALQLYTRVKNY